MAAVASLSFDQPGLHVLLERCDAIALDALPFGVIGFDAAADVRRYNAAEVGGAGLAAQRVLGRPLFTEVAQCLNNYLVAQRFDDAVEAGRELDETVPFTFTLRMKPTPVFLRLLSSPEHATQFIAILRRS